jgi:hypothetical protein
MFIRLKICEFRRISRIILLAVHVVYTDHVYPRSAAEKLVFPGHEFHVLVVRSCSYPFMYLLFPRKLTVHNVPGREEPVSGVDQYFPRFRVCTRANPDNACTRVAFGLLERIEKLEK